MPDRCTGVAAASPDHLAWISDTFGGRLVADPEGAVPAAVVWRVYRAEHGGRARSPRRQALFAEMLQRNTVLRRHARSPYFRGIRLATPEDQALT
jgi:hypothetical protein